MRALRIAVSIVGVWVVFGGHGCSSRRIQTCGLLPDAEACPVGRGGTCEDEACAALYTCLDGQWVLEKLCDPGTGGGGEAPSAGGGGAGGEACNGIEIDRTDEATSCGPPLQDPDCPAVAAELCRPCDTVCVDFFLCREGGWESVAFCDEDGHVIAEP